MIGGFVQQNDLRLLDEGSGQKHPLELSAGQLSHQPVPQFPDAGEVQAVLHRPAVGSALSPGQLDFAFTEQHPAVGRAKPFPHDVGRDEIHKPDDPHESHRRTGEGRHGGEQNALGAKQIHAHGPGLLLAEGHHVQFPGITQEQQQPQQHKGRQHSDGAPLPHGEAAKLP